MGSTKRFLTVLLTLTAIGIFLFSCIVTVADGQGALIFVFTVPAILILLGIAIFFTEKINHKFYQKMIYLFPRTTIFFIVAFFASTLIPILNPISDKFIDTLSKTFVIFIGKTPHIFFKERASFQNKLTKAIANKDTIHFSELDLSFAWDKVCIFEPYITNEKVNLILGFNWNIENYSKINQSDSIVALVFLYQGKVNQVVDFNRNIADFKNLNLCLNRNQSQFNIQAEPGRSKILVHYN